MRRAGAGRHHGLLLSGSVIAAGMLGARGAASNV